LRERASPIACADHRARRLPRSIRDIGPLGTPWDVNGEREYRNDGPSAEVVGRSIMGALSPLHLVIILVVAVLVIGPGKLPETGAALGHAIRDFRRAVEGEDDPVVGDGTAPGQPPEDDRP
jgi:sec-independent protein translocase protein TatA